MNKLPAKNSINVIVADDHPLYLKALIDTLRNCEFINRIVPAKTGIEVMHLLNLANYDLVLLDISMPEMDGEETAFQIAQQFPKVKTIAVSMFDSPLNIRRMYIAGCSSYIMKIQDQSEIIQSILYVLQGKKYFNKKVIEKLALEPDEEKIFQLQKKLNLSPQQIRLIRLVCDGKTSREIAELLNLSIRSIETYRAILYKKTGTSNFRELLHFATKHQLIIK